MKRRGPEDGDEVGDDGVEWLEQPDAWLHLAATATDADEALSGVPVSKIRRDVARILEASDGEAPGSRVLQGLDAVLARPRPSIGLRVLRALGVLGLALPEVEAMIGFHESCRVHHKDLWDHTLRVVDNTPAGDLRWVALLHDVGKVATRGYDDRGRVTFWRHEVTGAWLTAGIGVRLGMAPDRLARIAFVVEHSGRVNAYRSDWTDRAVGRLVRFAGPYLGDLLAFSAADYTTSRSRDSARIRARLAELRGRIDGLDAAAPVEESPLPTGLGHEVRATLGGHAGPHIGVALGWIRDEVAAGRLPSGAPSEVYITALVERGPTPPGDQNG